MPVVSDAKPAGRRTRRTAVLGLGAGGVGVEGRELKGGRNSDCGVGAGGMRSWGVSVTGALVATI